MKQVGRVRGGGREVQRREEDNTLTMARIPSGKRKRVYRVSTVSLMSTSHSLCKRIGPVSSPSSAQKILKPALVSPSMSVL